LSVLRTPAKRACFATWPGSSRVHAGGDVGRHVLLVGRVDRLLRARRHEDLHRGVRVADGALVEAALDTIVSFTFADLLPKKGDYPGAAGGIERTRLVEAPPCPLTTPASPAPWPPASGATGRRSASARRAASAPQPLPVVPVQIGPLRIERASRPSHRMGCVAWLPRARSPAPLACSSSPLPTRCCLTAGLSS
jgi:hypothetical protein